MERDLKSLGGEFLQEGVEFIPFDLESGEQGDDIVNIGAGGDITGQQVFAVVETAPATGPRGYSPALLTFSKPDC